jgi:hypothetical protein
MIVTTIHNCKKENNILNYTPAQLHNAPHSLPSLKWDGQIQYLEFHNTHQINLSVKVPNDLKIGTVLVIIEYYAKEKIQNVKWNLSYMINRIGKRIVNNAQYIMSARDQVLQENTPSIVSFDIQDLLAESFTDTLTLILSRDFVNNVNPRLLSLSVIFPTI